MPILTYKGGFVTRCKRGVDRSIDIPKQCEGLHILLLLFLLSFTPLSYAEKETFRTDRWDGFTPVTATQSENVDRVKPYLFYPLPRPINKASPAHVGSVMALLATFESSEVLPPEDSPQANKIVQALIQFQSAFMKSSHPAVIQFLEDACAIKFGSESSHVISLLRKRGWTSQTLEAIVDYDAVHMVWTPVLEEGFTPYNMKREDFKLLADIYTQARTSFTQRRQDIHQVYDQWRSQMPGMR